MRRRGQQARLIKLTISVEASGRRGGEAFMKRQLRRLTFIYTGFFGKIHFPEVHRLDIVLPIRPNLLLFSLARIGNKKFHRCASLKACTP